MIKYSLVLLTAAAVIFSTGCESECCRTPGPTAVISGLVAGRTVTTDSFILKGTESHDNNDGGSIAKYSWTVDGVPAAEGQTLSDGTHEVCLTVTDNDGLTNKTCGTVVVGTATTDPKAIITQLPTTCTPGDTLNVSGTTSTGNPTSYAWIPASIGTSANGTVACPASGSQEVCLTVTNAAGATNRTCKTVTAESSSCNANFIVKKDYENNITVAPEADITRGGKLWFIYEGSGTVVWSANNGTDAHTNCMAEENGPYHGTETSLTTYLTTCPGNDYTDLNVILTVTMPDGEDCNSTQHFNVP